MPEAENFQKTKLYEKENQNGEIENTILFSLVEELRREFGPVLEKIKVEDVRIGLAYTGVLLSENYGGVACTPLYEFSGCPSLGFEDTIKGRNANKVLELALSRNPLKLQLGLQQQTLFFICCGISNLKTFRLRT
ncbi:MAG: hypothetical protein NHB15_20570 [Methanosarcina barkeri]|nr:hypothetical protein [Methanosarcina sp. ERenArc_MAG2]